MDSKEMEARCRRVEKLLDAANNHIKEFTKIDHKWKKALFNCADWFDIVDNGMTTLEKKLENVQKEYFLNLQKYPTWDMSKYEEELSQLTDTTTAQMNNLTKRLIAVEEKQNGEETWLEEKLDKIQNKIRDLEQRQGALEDKEQNIVNTVNEAINHNGIADLKDQINTITKRLEKIEANLNIEKPFQDFCPYIWKIEHFSKLQEAAKSTDRFVVYSPPFFTHPNGYKMQLIIYPNGCAKGETHLSVFLQMMDGPMDAILAWPAQFIGTFTLLDQLTHVTHHKVGLSFEQVNMSMSRSVYKINNGTGWPKFIPLNRLEPLYLQNDVLFLKFEVQLLNCPSTVNGIVSYVGNPVSYRY